MNLKFLSLNIFLGLLVTKANAQINFEKPDGHFDVAAFMTEINSKNVARVKAATAGLKKHGPSVIEDIFAFVDSEKPSLPKINFDASKFTLEWGSSGQPYFLKALKDPSPTIRFASIYSIQYLMTRNRRKNSMRPASLGDNPVDDSWVNSAETLEAVLETTLDKNPEVRYWGVWACVQSNQKDGFPAGREFLKDMTRSPKQRWEYLKGFLYCNDPDAKSLLESTQDLFANKDALGFISDLGKIHTEACFQYLHQMLALYEKRSIPFDELWVVFAVQALGHQKRKESIPLIHALMRTSDWEVKWSVVQALAEIQGKESLNELLKLLDGADTDLRIGAIRGLAIIKTEKAFQALIKHLRIHKDDASFVFRALIEIGDRQAIIYIQPFTKSKDIPERDAALDAIKELKSKKKKK